MIDSGAATHARYGLHHNSTTPTSTWHRATTANSDQPAHQASRAQMRLHDKPQLTTDCIPFYVCEVKQPILSVTRLVEQGFQLTLDDKPKTTAHQRLQQHSGEQKWPVLPTSRNRNIAKRNKAADTQHRTRTDWHDSADHNAYTTRSCRRRMCRRLLAVQHTRRTCQSTQAIQQDAFHTIKNTVSSSSRATRGLQENNNQVQGRRNKYS